MRRTWRRTPKARPEFIGKHYSISVTDEGGADVVIPLDADL